MTETGTATITGTLTEAETEETKKPVKEVLVVHDQGFFRHDTGDMYDGFFEAKKKDRVVKMHGHGAYTTAEGECYSGTWEGDKLGGSEEVDITFIDGSKYEGMLKEWCYNAQGKYTYPDGSVLQGDFSENCPIGKLTLTDPNGHTWLGKADQGFGWFEPVNHFYDFLETTRDQNRLRRRHKNAQDLAGLSTSKTSSKLATVSYTETE